MSSLRKPGLIHTISGRGIDLNNFTEDDISILDIAWGLGRTLRYGGHIVEDYSVAHHSIIMSYYVAEEYALEALLHDAAEAYIGDLIWPVKALFPEMERFENELAHVIMKRFDVPSALSCHPIGLQNGKLVYKKSERVSSADRDLLEHECFEVGRAGTFHPNVEGAWLEAAMAHQEYWYAPQFAFLQRFRELIGIENPFDLVADGLIDELDQQWFRVKPPEVQEKTEEAIKRILAEEEAKLAEQPTPDEEEAILKEVSEDE